MARDHRLLSLSGMLILGVLVTVGVAACGNAGQSTQASQSAQDPPVTATALAPTYSPSDTIDILITNTSGETIYFADRQTNCTIILLKVQPVIVVEGTPGKAASATATAAATPQPVLNCAAYTTPTLYSLQPAGSQSTGKPTTGTTDVKLPPENGFWQAGTYVATLTYTTAPGDMPTPVSSLPFQVTAQSGNTIFPGPQVTATPGSVLVTSGCGHNPPCLPDETIHVTLTNQGGSSFYYLPNYTNCTYFLLQREIGTSTWENVENCSSPKTTALLQTEFKASTPPTTVDLIPPKDNPWPTGLYRVTLLYSLEKGLPPTCEASSAGFAVAAVQSMSGS
jgi:hypothetical protein